MNKAALIKAAENMDWVQVVLNGGPPCFYFERERGRFCGRAERWHTDDAPHIFHSLADLVAGRRQVKSKQC